MKRFLQAAVVAAIASLAAGSAVADPGYCYITYYMGASFPVCDSPDMW